MWVALAAGAVNILSFAPFHFWPLQIISLALMFLIVIDRGEFTLPRIALLGWAYGFGGLFSGVSWLIILMTRYNDLPLWLSVIGMALLATYLALFCTAAMTAGHYLQARWKLSASSALLLVFPALWILSEWLRGWVLSGFPWLVSGYAHVDSPLAGFAPILGVYGLGWLSAVISAALALLLLQRQNWKRMTLLMVAIMALGIGLRQIAWTVPHGQPLSVRLLQGNVDQSLKFDIEHVNESLLLYHDMIVAAPADLIVTPETALPILSSQLPQDYLPRLNAYIQNSKSNLILGMVVHDGGDKYTNSVLGFGSAYAAQAYRYDKHHLVPFGEFIPPGFRWFMKMMKIPFGELSRGEKVPKTMQIGDQTVLPNICYESIFGEEIARQLDAQSALTTGPASILLNASNLAWYGDSIAIPQHLQISQMRVLETGRPMLQATNTGATAVIDAHGDIVAQLQPLTRDTLAATVQGTSGLTPYIRFGNASVLMLALLSLMLAYVTAYLRTRYSK